MVVSKILKKKNYIGSFIQLIMSILFGDIYLYDWSRDQMSKLWMLWIQLTRPNRHR